MEEVELIEQEISDVYQGVMDMMSEGYSMPTPPNLSLIYEEFVENVSDYVLEAYQEFFGEGTTPRPDWLRDIGIDMGNMPTILVVCRILNAFGYSYTYKGNLYNYYTQPIFDVGAAIEED